MLLLLIVKKVASVEPVVVESGEDSDDSFSFSPIKKKTRRQEVNESTTSEYEEIEEVSNEIENRLSLIHISEPTRPY